LELLGENLVNCFVAAAFVDQKYDVRLYCLSIIIYM